MIKIVVSGWEVGFDKVEFNRFLRTNFGLSIKEAKQEVDKLLADHAIELNVSSDQEDFVINELMKMKVALVIRKG